MDVNASDQYKLELVSRLDAGCLSSNVDEVLEHYLAQAGRKAALLDLPPDSPLLDLADGVLGGFLGAGVRWYFDRSYWSNSPLIDPRTYFQVRSDEERVQIVSRGMAGASGTVLIPHDKLHDFFTCARHGRVRSTRLWAMDPDARDDKPILLRVELLPSHFDDSGPGQGCLPDYTGMLRIDPLAAGCQGEIFFGEPGQETRQLGALAQLEDCVRLVVSAGRYTAPARAEARERAAHICRNTATCYLPESGLCPHCGSDATLAFGESVRRALIAGCPICGSSWV